MDYEDLKVYLKEGAPIQIIEADGLLKNKKEMEIMKVKYYECENCGDLQVETEFGECSECSYEDLIEITEEEYNEKVSNS